MSLNLISIEECNNTLQTAITTIHNDHIKILICIFILTITTLIIWTITNLLVINIKNKNLIITILLITNTLLTSIMILALK